MLTLASDELREWGESNNNLELASDFSENKRAETSDSLKLFADKLCVPPPAARRAPAPDRSSEKFAGAVFRNFNHGTRRNG